MRPACDPLQRNSRKSDPPKTLASQILSPRDFLPAIREAWRSSSAGRNAKGLVPQWKIDLVRTLLHLSHELKEIQACISTSRYSYQAVTSAMCFNITRTRLCLTSLLRSVEDSDRCSLAGPDHLPKARPAVRYLNHGERPYLKCKAHE